MSGGTEAVRGGTGGTEPVRGDAGGTEPVEAAVEPVRGATGGSTDPVGDRAHGGGTHGGGGPRSVTVRVPAKVNVRLAVGAARPDGFHDLANVFLAVSSTTR